MSPSASPNSTSVNLPSASSIPTSLQEAENSAEQDSTNESALVTLCAQHAPLPAVVTSVDHLEELLSRPTLPALRALQNLDSDLVILGVSGKMGPTLARMAARGLAMLGSPYRVYGVARFSQPHVQAELETAEVQTIACDLLDRAALDQLPDSRNVIFMAGQKFGTTGNQHMTWAINTHLPALVCERYAQARMVAFSTGNVYALSEIGQGGAREGDLPQPLGEYAASCLGRERIFDYFSRSSGLPCAIMRLNYATELRYGVLVDVAQKVYAQEEIDLAMGAANVIWQGDANGQALALLDHCCAPPNIVNITGPETVSIRQVALAFGEHFGLEPHFTGREAPTALLSNAAKAHKLFGYPSVSLQHMIDWIAGWIQQDGARLNKPTHFETRDGKF